MMTLALCSLILAGELTEQTLAYRSNGEESRELEVVGVHYSI